MSWLAPLVLVLAQAASAPAPTAAPQAVDPKVAAQVPLISSKLDEWRGTWAAIDGKLACRTLKSSGDDEIDVIGCQAVIACVKTVYPELKDIADSQAAEADKKARIAAKLATLGTCMKEHRGQGIATLALKRGQS